MRRIVNALGKLNWGKWAYAIFALCAATAAMALAVLATGSAQAQTYTESVLYSFKVGTDGDGPFAGLVRDAQGNLYGTTLWGGAYDLGTVFKVDTNGNETVLHSFPATGGDGSQPLAGLVLDVQGNLYGTTGKGGDVACNLAYGPGCGTVFKVDTTGKETVLYSFPGYPGHGAYPNAGLVLDALGNLYGTTGGGGAADAGTVFKLAPPVPPSVTWTETVLHSFTGGADGETPSAGLVRDAQGNLYGTTIGGGAYDLGTVFKVDTNGNETVLHSFPATGGDGSQPRAGLVLDAQGNLYGTTYVGGASGDGTVFKLTAATSLACQVTPPVPSIPQNGGTWGGDPYDHLKGTTIAGKGCALTSLNMALNFAGESWNPGTLNSRLDATGGYGPKGVVLWGVATAASNGGRVSNPVIFDSLGRWANSDVNLDSAVQTVEKGICSATPLPVIVGVKSPTTGKYPGHFVLITGEIVNPDGSKAFTINDPYYPTTVIGNDYSTGNTGYTNAGQPEFWTRGDVHDPTDLTGLSVSVDAIADLVVTDPNGLQSGFYPGDPNPIQNIPHSGAGLDEIDDDVTGDAGGPVQSVMINSPATGLFQFSLTGAAAGQYSLVIGAEASDGTVQTSSFPGLTNVGATATYQLVYSPTPGAMPQPVLVASSAGTVPPSQVSATASGLAYSRVSKTFNGTVTIQNISGSAINGPFQIFFTSLTAGVSLANATSTFSGMPYLTVPKVSSLPPGRSATVNVQFKNPSNIKINFTPVIYSGSIN